MEVADAATNYSVNDVIEVGNDAVMRTVTGVTGTTITFTPALPEISIPRNLVYNWGAGATDSTFDLNIPSSSPCLGTGVDAAVPAVIGGGVCPGGAEPVARLEAVDGADVGTGKTGAHISVAGDGNVVDAVILGGNGYVVDALHPGAGGAILHIAGVGEVVSAVL